MAEAVGLLTPSPSPCPGAHPLQPVFLFFFFSIFFKITFRVVQVLEDSDDEGKEVEENTCVISS